MRVVIHVGPGKTGSSAIQKWLSDNREYLSSNGIYYPEHRIDSNGVSSGNAQSLFSYNKQGRLEFNEGKAKNLLTKARKSGAKVLVLSSEAFIERHTPIVEFFKDAEYVYYLRNPIESAESLYNQSVKRHFNAGTVNPPKHINFRSLIHLYELSDGKVHIRKYGKTYFINGDIVADFLSVIDTSLQADELAPVVNLSYSLEALEFKRRLNFFPAASFHAKLDNHLQKYQGKVIRFSLLTPMQFENARKLTIERLKQLSEIIHVDLSDFVEEIKQVSQRPCYQQQLTSDEAYLILSVLNMQQPDLVVQIRQIIEWQLLPLDAARPLDEALKKLTAPSLPFNQRIVRAYKKAFSKQSHFKQLAGLNHYIKRIGVKSWDARADLFRDMAQLYQENELDLAAIRCLAEAKFYRPHGKYINQMLAEQANQLYKKF